jgi:type IV pilus assembly protein PilM
MDEKQSIWKKEISLRKAPVAKAGVEAAAHVDAPESAEATPFWKKEIRLGGGAKAPKASKAPKAEKPAKQPKAPKAKKVKAEKPTAAEGEKVSFWKKDISLGKGKQPEPVVEPVPDAVERVVAAAPPVEAVAAVEDSWAAPETLPPAPLEEQATSEFSFLTASVSEPATPPAPVELPVPEPAPALPPAAAVELPAPVAVPVAEPVVQEIHPPVPASELPPLPGEDKKPFWKKELGKPKAPKAEKPRKPAKPKLSKEEQAAAKLEQTEAKAARKSEPKVKRVKGDKAEKGAHRAKKVVGLKIGASQIAAARVSNNGSVVLHQVAREALDDGIVVGGELRDPEALAESLKAFFRKHKLPKKGVRLGIANNRIGVRTFEISGIDDPKQLANAIRFRAQEALPIPIDEAVLDYQVLSESTDAEGVLTRRILLVVAYRELIDRYVAACKKAGLTLSGIDLEAFALLRALAEPQDGTAANSGAALVAVSIGHERSTFAVSDGRVCEFTRVLEWGGGALNIALARSLDIAPSEAEPFKRALSLLAPTDVEGLTETQVAAAREAMQKQVQSFARELVSSLQFYQNQPGSLGIGEIVLTGGTAHLPGLAEELQRLIGVAVRIGDPLARVRVNRKVSDPEQVGSLAVAIGLGIED